MSILASETRAGIEAQEDAALDAEDKIQRQRASSLVPCCISAGGSAGCGWRVPRDESGGDGQNGLRVVAVRSGCAGGQFRRMSEGEACCAVDEAATERVVATLFLVEILCDRTFGVENQPLPS
jgi:hypothetical protein